MYTLYAFKRVFGMPQGGTMEAFSYEGKCVVVTGGASFIGSHLVEELVRLGSSVTVVDDLSSGTMQNLHGVMEKIEFINGDLRDQKIAQQSFRGADIVFHLANIHGGRGFIESHPGEISQNFLIDGNVFLAAKENGIDRICYTSSACVYPTNLQTLDSKDSTRYLSEEMADPFVVGGANADGVYGWAKFMGELQLKSYQEQFGLKGVSCRLFTVYGPRENESHAIIAFIAKALLKQSPFEIWGSGKQDRNFTYVADVVEGLLKATALITDGSSVNIGTDEITTIIDAAKIVCKIVGHDPSSFFFDVSKPEGVAARAASVEKSLEKLKWKPVTKFEEGIKETIEWYASTVNLKELTGSLERKLMERG
jgi:UDP-glucose 4-epimerase